MQYETREIEPSPSTTKISRENTIARGDRVSPHMRVVISAKLARDVVFNRRGLMRALPEAKCHLAHSSSTCTSTRRLVSCVQGSRTSLLHLRWSEKMQQRACNSAFHSSCWARGDGDAKDNISSFGDRIDDEAAALPRNGSLGNERYETLSAEQKLYVDQVRADIRSLDPILEYIAWKPFLGPHNNEDHEDVRYLIETDVLDKLDAQGIFLRNPVKKIWNGERNVDVVIEELDWRTANFAHRVLLHTLAHEARERGEDATVEEI